MEAYPLYWPEGWKRTERYRRKENRQFSKGFATYRDELFVEIRRLGGKKVVLSTNIPLRNDGIPYANFREPEDPGVAVYFEYKRKPMCFACDSYRLVRENLRAVSLTINAIRGLERWGASDMMERAFRGFTAIEDKSGSWMKTLGFEPGELITKDRIDQRYRSRSLEFHPDRPGGSADKFHALAVAREHALSSLEPK